jgi:hypothetical protein
VQRPLGLVRLEDHHRDLAVGPALELVIGCPSRGHAVPQLGLLLGRSGPRPSGVVVDFDLHGPDRIVLKVKEPVGWIAAAVGGHHEVASPCRW